MLLHSSATYVIDTRFVLRISRHISNKEQVLAHPVTAVMLSSAF